MQLKPQKRMTLAVNIFRRFITVNYTLIINKVILFAIVILGSSNCFAQDLYVDDNSYLYARDIVLFVNDDIRLETTASNIYMRGSAQLVQNTDTKNSDAGELSIYQNQTSGVYEYNYWCSPVGVSIDGTTKANVPFSGSNIHDPDNDTDLANVISTAYLYTAALNGTATQISSRWMYTLKDGEGYFSWAKEDETSTINTGYGFTLKGSPTTNNVLDFRGRPNNGTISVSCNFDGVDDQPSGYANSAATLTGNPYPSAIDLKLFFANSVNNQTILRNEIYFWEQKQINSHHLTDYEGGYGIYVPGPLGDLFDNGTYTTAPFKNYNTNGTANGNTSGNTTDYSTNNQRRYAAIGQGFLIGSTGSGGNAVFNNSMRVYFPEDSSSSGNGSVFGKTDGKTSQDIQNIPMSHNGIDYKSIFETPKVIPEIRLHTHINNLFYKENVIAFRESTPNNNTYNKLYDGININNLNSDVYLISEDKNLSIKSINYSETTRLKLGFKVENNNTAFNVKINRLTNIPENVEMYVYDNNTNEYTDLANGAFYIILNRGVYNERFEITFAKNSLNTNEAIFNEFKVFHNHDNEEINLLNPNSLTIKSINVFDVSGKLVLSNLTNSSNKTLTYSTKLFNAGIYVIKIETKDNHFLNKKFVVNKIN